MTRERPKRHGRQGAKQMRATTPAVGTPSTGPYLAIRTPAWVSGQRIGVCTAALDEVTGVRRAALDELKRQRAIQQHWTS